MATPVSALLFLLACTGTEAIPTAAPAVDAPPPAPPAPQAPAGAPSLVIITTDTTRADRIGAYGYAPAHTPAMDQLAREGVRFARAYATVPLTTPSHASMFTGVYPPRHGIRNNGDATLPASFTTLAEHAQAAGWRTAASVSAFVTTRIWGLDQGFDAYFDDVTPRGRKAGRWGQERRADAVVDDLATWLAEKPSGQPFVAWAHFYDPHEPYDPPPAWKEKMPGRPYDAEIAAMDEQIGRLRGLAEAAAGPGGVAFIVLADHGEAINGEHGEQTHGLYVFDPTMRIPFIVRPAKALASPVVVQDITVSNVDLMPTALGILGLPVPAGLDGADLSPTLAGPAPARGPVYMESETPKQRFGFHPEVAVAQGALKYFATPNALLFDVDVDPAEANTLLPGRAAESLTLAAYAKEVRARTSEGSAAGPSPEVMDQLAALGYVSNDFDRTSSDEGRPDAKDKAGVIAALESARARSRRPKEFKEAVAAYQKVLAEFPDMGEARMGLAGVLQRMGRHAEAEQVLRDAVAREPGSTVLRANLASAIAAQGRLPEALDLVQSVHAQVPGDQLSQYAILKYLTDMGRLDEGLRLSGEWLGAKPGDHGLMALRGVLLLKSNKPAEAEPLLVASLADHIPREAVHRALALIAAARGDTAAAVEWLQAGSEAFPQDLQVRLELANALMRAQRWDDAAAEYAAIVERNAKDDNARRSWAQAIFNAGDYPGAAKILAPALVRRPDDPDILLLHANLLAKEGKMDQAKQVFEEAKKFKAARDERERAEAPPAAIITDGAEEPGAVP